MRAALGAARSRIIWQFLAEGLLLAAGGGALGVLLAAAAIRIFVYFKPIEMPIGANPAIHQPTFWFAAGVAMLTILIFALGPAIRMSRIEVSRGLGAGRMGFVLGGWRGRLSNAVVISEIALSVALLAGAGLLTDSVVRMGGEHLGFEPENVLTTSLHRAGERYTTAEQRLRYYAEIARRLRALPGVQGVSLARPLAAHDGVQIGGQQQSGRRIVGWEEVDPSYLDVWKIPLIAGRTFTERDQEGGEAVTLVNQAFAKEFFPDGNAVGQRLRIGEGQGRTKWMTIIGVAGNVKGQSLFQELSWTEEPVVLRPLRQDPQRRIAMAVRVAPNAAGVAEAIRREVEAFDSKVTVGGLQPMTSRLGRQLAYPRFRALLFGAFAIIAVLLAGIGLYGVLTQLVGARRREFALRVALGARQMQVFALVARHGSVLAIAGLLIGSGGAWALSRSIASLLYQAQPVAVVTLGAVVAAMLVATGIAMILPAYRATTVDPMTVLREE